MYNEKFENVVKLRCEYNYSRKIMRSIDKTFEKLLIFIYANTGDSDTQTSRVHIMYTMLKLGCILQKR